MVRDIVLFLIGCVVGGAGWGIYSSRATAAIKAELAALKAKL